MTLQEAIERSISHDESVSLDYAGTESDLMVALDQLHDGDIDSTHENNGNLDVWGWTAETPQDTQDWRLCVTLTS